jgi:hypothetical protein
MAIDRTVGDRSRSLPDGERSERIHGPAVIRQPSFAVEPWRIRETELHLDVLSQSESVFALSNGHIGVRGNLDEGEPYGLPGSYLNGFYELRPLPYAEAGFGNPESGQTVINVTNGKIVRLLVDDEPFDVRYGDLESHERVLSARSAGSHRPDRWWRSRRCGWSPSRNGPSSPFAMRWNPLKTGCTSWSNPT